MCVFLHMKINDKRKVETNMNYEKFRETLAEEVRRQAEGRLLVRLETVTKK